MLSQGMALLVLKNKIRWDSFNLLHSWVVKCLAKGNVDLPLDLASKNPPSPP